MYGMVWYGMYVVYAYVRVCTYTCVVFLCMFATKFWVAVHMAYFWVYMYTHVLMHSIACVLPLCSTIQHTMGVYVICRKLALLTHFCICHEAWRYVDAYSKFLYTTFHSETNAVNPWVSHISQVQKAKASSKNNHKSQNISGHSAAFLPSMSASLKRWKRLIQCIAGIARPGLWTARKSKATWKDQQADSDPETRGRVSAYQQKGGLVATLRTTCP